MYLAPGGGGGWTFDTIEGSAGRRIPVSADMGMFVKYPDTKKYPRISRGKNIKIQLSKSAREYPSFPFEFSFKH